MGAKGILFEDEPPDWFIDEEGGFQERGRADEGGKVKDCIHVQHPKGLPKVLVPRLPKLVSIRVKVPIQGSSWSGEPEWMKNGC